MWKEYPLKYKEKTVVSYNDDKHQYYVNGKEVFSATTIIEQGLLKPSLTDWLITTPMYKFKYLISEQIKNKEPIDKLALEKIFKEARNATNTIKENGAMIGSVVHSLIEDFLNKKEILPQSDPKVTNCWNLFLGWWNDAGYVPIEIEKKLYSKKHNYVGTLDLIVRDKSGKLVLIDIKTSNFISFGYVLQANAYQKAYEEETGKKISEAFCLRLDKKSDAPEIAPMPLTTELFNAFLGAKYISEQRKISEYV
tara:strand:- start:1454 stop:2209 length:756 start_codon:yes stop_codon:yes gene_type:complete